MMKKIQRRYQQSPPTDDWLERFTRFNLHFGRYLRDVTGILLIALALISLLGIWGLTSGVILSPWSAFLSTWFGWGSYLLLLATGLTGFGLIRRMGGIFSWGRLFALELASLLTLGLLSILGGNS
jgi:hypothetical protein